MTTWRTACAAALLAAGPAFAQAPPAEVDLPTVLRLAREANPRLALERQEVTSAMADRVTAAARPNPVVSVGRAYQPGALTNFGSQRAQDVSVELPLQLGGQRGARMAAAERGIDAARARVFATGNELATEAGAAYVALLLEQQRAAILGANLEEMERLREVIAQRRASGLASDYELLRVDVEQVALRNQAAEATADVAERQARLAALLGFRDWRPRGSGPLQALPVEPAPAAALEAAGDHPEVAAARRQEEQSRAAIDVARREQMPAVSLNGGQFWTSSPYGKTLSVGISVEIPLLDKRQGAVDKASAEATSAELRRQLAEARVSADIASFSTQVTQRMAALGRFQRETGARLDSLRQMAIDSYRLGKTSITELLDATRARHATQLGRLELLAGLMESQLRLQGARGLLAAPNALEAR